MKRVSLSVPSLERRHGPVSRRVSVARRQRRDTGPWHIDLQVSRRLSRRPVVPSLFRPTACDVMWCLGVRSHRLPLRHKSHKMWLPSLNARTFWNDFQSFLKSLLDILCAFKQIFATFVFVYITLLCLLKFGNTKLILGLVSYRYYGRRHF